MLELDRGGPVAAAAAGAGIAGILTQIFDRVAAC